MSETPVELPSTHAHLISGVTSVAAEVRLLNMAYLSLVKQMLASDRKLATRTLGLSAQVADVLGNLSAEQVTRLVNSSQILCRFRFGDHEMLTALAEKMDSALFETTRQARVAPEIETAVRTK